MKVKTKGEEKWFAEYEIEYKWYSVSKGGFRESTHYFRTDAVERAIKLNEVDEILKGESK